MNLQELKHNMNHVPDHVMHHDKPMHGPITAKKGEMAGKMNLEALRAKKKADMQKPVHKGWEPTKHANMSDAQRNTHARASQPSQSEQHAHQRNVGRSYND